MQCRASLVLQGGGLVISRDFWPLKQKQSGSYYYWNEFLMLKYGMVERGMLKNNCKLSNFVLCHLSSHAVYWGAAKGWFWNAAPTGDCEGRSDFQRQQGQRVQISTLLQVRDRQVSVRRCHAVTIIIMIWFVLLTWTAACARAQRLPSAVPGGGCPPSAGTLPLAGQVWAHGDRRPLHRLAVPVQPWNRPRLVQSAESLGSQRHCGSCGTEAVLL